ncbi:hypothetical protein DFH09DRAFT_364859 [Mycena vulgaris]|nr:hypothetical protein DFH09DRAFT_364859 [Mycena vulgaris]
MSLRVGYVWEHFSTPLLQFQDADQNQTFTLVECPSRTGQLISRLTKDEIDVAMYCLPAASVSSKLTDS